MKREEKTIDAVVQRCRPDRVWIYRKPDSLWTILLLVRPDSGRKFTAKGVIQFEPRHGDRLKLTGTWMVSEFNGEPEFVFSSALMQVPTDARALLSYAATITSGIGPVREEEIWTAWGEQWMDHPELEGLDGLSDTVRYNWKETLARLSREQSKTNVIGFLMGKGCSLTIALKAFDLWGEDAIGKTEADPYALAELPRVGFRTVDGDIRRAFGVEDKDPRRVRAALLYAARELSEKTGTLMSSATLCEHDAVPHVAGTDADQALRRLVDEGLLVEVSTGMIALAEDYANERAIFMGCMEAAI